MRKLTKTLAVVSFLAPASGYSLGIGDIKLHSALNQNLDAEISLVVSAGEKASDIKVNLAPPDKFDEAGVPWASFLSKIKFSTTVGRNGSLIIKLSSREAVKEPFLDFLLEVSWPKGSLYREFTVLLDPPVVYGHATVPVSNSYESYESDQPVYPQHRSRQKQQVNAERSVGSASVYGPTRRNDTLWKIAEQAGRQEGVSVEQMMIAIYEGNPRAFFKENVHALSAGKTLKIPSRQTVLKFSRKQALAEYKQQTKAWKNRLEPAPIETETVNNEAPDNQLKLVAPTETGVAEKAVITPENEQVTAKKKIDDFAPNAAQEEVVNTPSPANVAIQDKVAELEKQLAMMQQILALKDQQLATLQNQSQTKSEDQPSVAQPTKPEPPVVVSPVTQQKPAQPTFQPKPKEVSTSSSAPYAWIVGIGGGMLSMLGWLWWRKRKLDEQTGLFTPSGQGDSLEPKNLSLASGEKGGALGALNDASFRDFGRFDTDQGEIDPVSEADVYLAYGRYQQAEELMRDVIKNQPDSDECKLKLLEIFYSNDNKSAFESYANELAQAGKKADTVFWAKVTEMGSKICQDSALFAPEVIEDSSLNERTIFEEHASTPVSLVDVKKHEVIKTKDANPSPLAVTEINKESVKELAQKAGGLLDFDLNFFDDEVVDDTDDEQKNNESIDFGLENKTVSLTKDNDLTSEFDENNFEVSTFGEPLNNEAVSERQREKDFDLTFFEDDVDREQQNNESIDFNFSASPTLAEESNDTLERAVSKAREIEASNTDDSFDFDLDSNEIEASGIDDIDLTVSKESSNRDVSFEKRASDFDQQEESFEVYDLTDMDELETKLDLAKAYIDMNDVDAAKDMAYEVLKKGTAEQKKIAQALLDDLK